ncbi:SAM-dependent methyltransferase, partial [Streptomyces sp. TRM76130]|nr:SAM-dependent methyltransferase [Streptomyces sp. TRM76130]
AQQVVDQYARAGMRLGLRTRPEVARFFDGLELIEPGLVTAPEWYGPEQQRPEPEVSGIYAAVARIP